MPCDNAKLCVPKSDRHYPVLPVSLVCVQNRVDICKVTKLWVEWWSLLFYFCRRDCKFSALSFYAHTCTGNLERRCVCCRTAVFNMVISVNFQTWW